MKVLITGGCGFLGSNLACSVIERRKHDLYILDSLYRTGSRDNLNWLKGLGKFRFYKLDIRFKKAIEKIIRRIEPDVIFHLAGQVAMSTSIENPFFDFEVNVLGTLNVLEAIRKYSPDTVLIYSSTNKVYGSLDWVKYRELKKRYVAEDFPNGFSEDTPLDFHSPYGCSKGCADQYVLDFCRLYRLKTVVFRHSSMYGNRQFGTYNQGWISWFCQKALETKKGLLEESFTISGDGKQVRDVLFADDVVHLYLRVVENIEKVKGNAFNIGGGVKNSLSLLELFDILEEKLDIKLKYIQKPWRFSDQKVFIADISKIKKMCGWSPSMDKMTGIDKTIEWIRTCMK